MESWMLYCTSLLMISLAMFSLAMILQARLTRQLVLYSKGILRYCFDEASLQKHLVAHGIKTEQAGKIVAAAREMMLREQVQVILKSQGAR